jgi:hypothetical protein
MTWLICRSAFDDDDPVSSDSDSEDDSEDDSD